MDLDSFTNQLANQAGVIHTLTLGVSAGQARWKPGPQAWSILEVINHLFDEECADFRVRLDLILYHPAQPWPPIDPQGWVTGRHYNQRGLAHSLDNFLKERRKSLAWLRGLDAPDWDASVTSPFGKFSAGDIFAAWVAHDLLHMRQLVELHWAYTLHSAQPYRVNYAGDW
jgi:hypothetical protein